MDRWLTESQEVQIKSGNCYEEFETKEDQKKHGKCEIK